MLNTIRQYVRKALGSSTFVLSTTCLLGISSYFFGQPMAIELHWFWMALLSLSIVALPTALFVRSIESRQLDDELQAVLDAAPHALFFKDTSLRYRQINAEFLRLFDVGNNGALGKNDLELFGPVESRRFTAEDIELMKSGRTRNFEDQMLIEGVLRIIRTRKKAVSDRTGTIRGVVGVSIDVTDQLHLERQFKSANDRLDMALEAAGMGTWECDLRTGKIDADERARHVLGLRPEDDHLASAFARIHPDDEEEIRARMALSRTRSEVMSYEFRVVEASGAVRWVEGFSLPNARRDDSEYLIGVNRDITRRRLDEIALADAKTRTDRALTALEASQLDLELALSVGGLGVWQSITTVPMGHRVMPSDFRDTVLAADAKIREIVGDGGDAEIRYGDLLKLLHPDDRARAVHTLGLALRDQAGTYRDQFRILARDEVTRTVDVKGVVQTLASSAGAGDQMQVSFTGIVRDISKDEALKNDLQAKAEQARSAEEAKAQFLAMMSHEVRTPLNGVLGMVELVLDTPLTDAQRSMLQRSRESSVALLTIINDILDFSKIEARKLEIDTRPLSLASLIADVCAILAPEAQRKKIRLSHSVDERIPQFILGDSVRLRQVLTNLIGNAIKFTSAGGVDVSARRLSDVSFQLAVRDTGIGIKAESATRLFEPFYQAEGSTFRFGGTGLGLTIVKQLVDLMRGDVRCESEPGRGSTFIVTLPLRPWLTGTSAADRADNLSGRLTAAGLAARPIGSGLRLLLAEDHEVNREVITLQLAKLGFACDVAEDGEVAWQMLMAPAARYAMLLTDCRMPRLDGYDLAARLRAHEAAQGQPRLPIVALTANALEGEAERCRAAGMDVYLTKPLQLQEFQDALSGILNKAQGRPAASEPSPSMAAKTGPSAAPARAPSPSAHMVAESSPAYAPAAPRYPALAQLCGGDLDKVARLVQVFVNATQVDLQAMDRAAEDDDHPALRQLAHRLASACHQLDEHALVDALRGLERLIDEDDIGLEQAVAERYPSLRALLAKALARASEFVRLQALPRPA